MAKEPYLLFLLLAPMFFQISNPSKFQKRSFINFLHTHENVQELYVMSTKAIQVPSFPIALTFFELKTKKRKHESIDNHTIFCNAFLTELSEKIEPRRKLESEASLIISPEKEMNLAQSDSIFLHNWTDYKNVNFYIAVSNIDGHPDSIFEIYAAGKYLRVNELTRIKSISRKFKRRANFRSVNLIAPIIVRLWTKFPINKFENLIFFLFFRFDPK